MGTQAQTFFGACSRWSGAEAFRSRCKPACRTAANTVDSRRERHGWGCTHPGSRHDAGQRAFDAPRHTRLVHSDCVLLTASSHKLRDAGRVFIRNLAAIPSSGVFANSARGLLAVSAGAFRLQETRHPEEVFMSITRWDPFRELEDMNLRLNRIFGGGAAAQRGSQEQMTVPDWHPSVDISETPEAFQIVAELPEVKKDDIKVTIENGVLSLRGERRQEKEDKGKRFHRIERSYGSFMRSFSLPDNVDESKVKADIKDGLLTVTVGKAETKKPKSVDVKIG